MSHTSMTVLLVTLAVAYLSWNAWLDKRPPRPRDEEHRL